MTAPWTGALIAQMRMEWRLQWARPFVWFCLLGAFGMAFGATVENGFGQTGFSWVNGADAIATRALILSVLGIVAAAGVVGEAMSRDRITGVEETVLATGIGRSAYGLGRFLAAFGVMVLIGAAFVPGMILGAMVPGIDPARIGPFEPGHYLRALAVYVLPNIALVSALVYAVAARWQSQTAAFITALGLIALYVTALMMLGQDVYRHNVFAFYALMDPYGNIAGAEHSIGWTVAQNNTTFRPFTGLLLGNRLLWLGVAGALVVLGTLAVPRTLRLPAQPRPRRQAVRPQRLPLFGDAVLLRLTLWELTALWRQPGVLLLLGFAAFSLWWSAASAVTYSFSLPTTDLLIHNSDFYFDKVLVLVTAWYAGEIVWRERAHRVDALFDVSVIGDGLRLAGKTLALMAIVLVFWSLSIAVNIAYQLATGFHDLELWLYLTDTYLFRAPYYLWLAVLGVALQVILRQRYIAMAALLLVWLSGTLFDALGLYHPLYRFGDTGFFFYSLMDGYGHFWPGHMWFALYWSLACAVLWLLAWGCQAAGTEPPPRRALWRLRLLSGTGGAAFACALAGLVVCGGWILWQTTQQHRWPLLDEGRYMAGLERDYRAAWGDVPQPKITAITGDIALYPGTRRVEMHGTITVRNDSAGPVPELIAFFHPFLKTARLDLDGIATLDRTRSAPLVQVWRLAQPMAPGAVLDLPFRTAAFPDPGFAAHNQHDRVPEVQGAEVIGNGTSILNLNLIPALGYSERLEHKPAWLRRAYGLAPDWAPPPGTLGDRVAHDTTHLAWVDSVDVTVSTDADQVPLHAGEIVEDLGIRDGRRTIRYRMHRPSRGWAEVMSGRYALFRAARPGLPPVELYYHPPHAYTLEPMAEAVLDAMAYFRDRYGPPPFETFRMAEASLHYAGLGARGGLAFVNEVLGWQTDLAASKGEDLRDFAANLTAQGWWLDQIMPANLPGAKSVLTGLPYWTAGLYLHHARGPERSREMRLQAMQEAFRHRAGLDDAERPFAQEMKDSTMIRLKGPLHVLYLDALAEALAGPGRLEQALAGFLDTWRFRPAPYPTATDLIAHLKAELPTGMHGALDDFFSAVTTWRLRVVSAEARQNGSGTWTLRAEVEARKFHSHGLGEETEVPPGTPLPLAVFDTDGFGPDSVIAQEWRTLDGGLTEIEITVPRKPGRIGLDPYLLLPDPNPHDNVAPVIQPAG